MFSLSRHGARGHHSFFSKPFAFQSRAAPFRWPARAYATAPSTSLSKPTRSIYVSNSTNPYFNLTFEDWLFRFHPPDTPLLLLYRDAPCVVIGRNQNPWKEVNLVASDTRGIPWIRRRSGGGTVYHDLGNTNYSIHVPRTMFDRRVTANVVVRALRALSIDAYANERNDICVAGEKMSRVYGLHYPSLAFYDIHISGSAYKIVNNRAYHHGTMLISTRLDNLGDLLRTNKEAMKTKGVASVRSPVRNLSQSSASVTHEAFVDSIIRSFREEYAVREEPCFINEAPEYLDDEYFRFGMSDLRSWQWAYGQTPEFEYVITKAFQWGQLTSTIRSKHGLISSCLFSVPRDARLPPDIHLGLASLGERLAGKRYAFVDDSEVLGNSGSEMAEIWSWFKHETSV